MPAELARFPMHHDQGRLSGGGGLDPTPGDAGPQTGSALRELNEKLEAIVEERTRERDRLWALSGDLLVAADFEGRFLRVSPSWSRLLGVEAAALLTRSYLDVVHPDDREVARATLDGMRRTGRPARVDNRVQSADRTWRWIAWTLTPDPAARRIHGVGRDVTAERQAADALRQAEAQLRQSHKMEVIGQLAGGVAHDVNNLLTSVLGNLELLEPRLDDESLRKLVRGATRSAERGTELARQLLALARKQHLSAKPVDLNAVIAGMTEMLRRTLADGIEVRTTLDPDLWPVVVDRTQIEVAFLNVAINARDAMPNGGFLEIGTRNAPAAGRWRSDDLPAGDYVAVSLADSGQGMPAEVLAQAFTPFFTTKGPGKGTGLGLPQVYRVARQSGGTARVRSVPSAGTTVEIWLPRASAAESEPGANVAGPVADRQGDAYSGGPR